MSHPVDVHVGQKFKSLRVMRGLTQTELADGLGISFQQVQKYELGRNRISASRLFESARLLGVPISYFFEGLEQDGTSQGPQLDQEAAKVAAAYSNIKDDNLRVQVRNFIANLAHVDQ